MLRSSSEGHPSSALLPSSMFIHTHVQTNTHIAAHTHTHTVSHQLCHTPAHTPTHPQADCAQAHPDPPADPLPGHQLPCTPSSWTGTAQTVSMQPEPLGKEANSSNKIFTTTLGRCHDNTKQQENADHNLPTYTISQKTPRQCCVLCEALNTCCASCCCCCCCLICCCC
jgi:hypothetical protein